MPNGGPQYHGASQVYGSNNGNVLVILQLWNRLVWHNVVRSMLVVASLHRKLHLVGNPRMVASVE